MWANSGITFTIKYWGEVMRLTLCFVDPHGVKVFDVKTWVARHKKKSDPFCGLPKVLPNAVKLLCVDVKKGIRRGSLPRLTLVKYKLLISLLAFFRATSPKFSPVKIDTIRGPFTGTIRVLPDEEVREALVRLGIKDFCEKKPSIFRFCSKAGPNAPLAVLGIGFDTLG
jgi:hypothetical protein